MKLVLRVATLLLLLATVWAHKGVQPGKVSKKLLDLCARCCGSIKSACPSWCPPCRFPGQCPYVNRAVIRCGSRHDTCSSDRDCPKQQRCCEAGCGKSCSPVCSKPCPFGTKCIKNTIFCIRAPCPQPPPSCVANSPAPTPKPTPAPTPKPTPSLPRPGQCPESNVIPFLACSPSHHDDECSSDADCPGSTNKCCRQGCARRCIEPCRPRCARGQRCVREQGVTCQAIGCPPAPYFSVCKPLSNPCAAVSCPTGSRCVVRNGRGQCVKVNPCAAVSCPTGSRCEVRNGSGQCVKVNPCARVLCLTGSRCVVRNGEGVCIKVNPCALLKCGLGKRCVARKGRGICIDKEYPIRCGEVFCLPGTDCVRRKGKQICVRINPCDVKKCGWDQICVVLRNQGQGVCVQRIVPKCRGLLCKH
nr:adult cement protein 22 [Chelonibia testudinaria]